MKTLAYAGVSVLLAAKVIILGVCVYIILPFVLGWRKIVGKVRRRRS